MSDVRTHCQCTLQSAQFCCNKDHPLRTSAIPRNLVCMLPMCAQVHSAKALPSSLTTGIYDAGDSSNNESAAMAVIAFSVNTHTCHMQQEQRLMYVVYLARQQLLAFPESAT